MGRVLAGLISIVIGIVGGGIFVGWGLYTIGNITLTCQRVESNQINCTIQEGRWLGLKRITTELPQVEKARRDPYTCQESTRTSSGKKKYTEKTCYNLVIETKSGDIHPTNYLPTTLADDINEFIASGQPTWKYESGFEESLFGLIFAILGTVVGLMFVLAGLTMLFGTVTQTSATKPQ